MTTPPPASMMPEKLEYRQKDGCIVDLGDPHNDVWALIWRSDLQNLRLDVNTDDFLHELCHRFNHFPALAACLRELVEAMEAREAEIGTIAYGGAVAVKLTSARSLLAAMAKEIP